MVKNTIHDSRYTIHGNNNCVVVVGGGAAGMISAIRAAENGNKVTLIEKNEKLGKKLYITGKGRCNIANLCTGEDFFKNVNSNPKFLISAINKFSPSDLYNFFEGLGVKLKVERGGRVFPASDKSADILDALKKRLNALKVEIKLNESVVSFKKENNRITQVVTNKGQYAASYVILATGGASYPLTGSTGDGYIFAKQLGHTVIEPKPALTPIIFDMPFDPAYPQGLSLKNVTAKIGKFEEFGEMLFTDNGVSGPIVLTLSSKITNTIHDSRFTIHDFKIDLKPALTEEQLDNRILKDFGENKNKQFKNALDALLPKSLIDYIVKLSKINPEKPVNTITKAERQGLVKLLKGLTFKIKRLGGFESAIITVGGVCVKEINPATMKSKLVENLYFAGELIDLDAFTGGFNLQIAFSTGHVAGMLN
jgi:hypothetical protein